MLSRLFMFILLISLINCNKDYRSNLDSKIKIQIADQNLKFYLPGIKSNSVECEKSDYNSNVYSFNKFYFNSNGDTASIEIKYLILGTDSCINDEIRIFDWTKNRVLTMNRFADRFRNEILPVSDIKLYVTTFNSGFFAVGCFDKSSFTISLDNVNDSVLRNSIIQSIKFEL